MTFHHNLNGFALMENHCNNRKNNYFLKISHFTSPLERATPANIHTHILVSTQHFITGTSIQKRHAACVNSNYTLQNVLYIPIRLCHQINHNIAILQTAIENDCVR